jgi:hypothetical protein
LENPKEFSFSKTVKAWWWCSVPVLLFAVPHYLINRVEIINYTFTVAVGSGRKTAILPGNGNDHALYFLTGISGRYMLEYYLHVAGGIIVAGMVFLIAMLFGQPGARLKLVRAACLGFITFVAYLVPTLVGLGNPFFGTEFDFLLILGAVMVLRMFAVHAGQGTPRWVGRGALVVGCLAGIVLGNGFPQAGWTQMQGRNYSKVVREVADLVVDKAPVESRIYLTGTGWINSDTLQYLAHQQAKHYLFTDSPFTDDVKDEIQGFGDADFVLAAETGVPAGAL